MIGDMKDEIESWGEVVEVGATWVRLKVGAEAHRQKVLFDLPYSITQVGDFQRAMERKQKVRVTITVPEEPPPPSGMPGD